MSVIPIRLVGDEVLRAKAEPVTDFDAELRTLIDDLTETLENSGGAGLSAPQLGVSLRVFAISPKITDGEIHHLVNPVLDFPDDEEQDGPEGCLSIPGVYLDTRRRKNVIAKGFSSHGDPVQIVGEGLVSRCVQHENDHLDGVLFIDRQRPEQQERLLATLRASAWWDESAVKISPH
ncbi:peptide deformylase [Actinoplanes sp. NPDC049265]|uniref:peptide deformylase n=1 Tax=Actinoplanes sp. NPDC049265 TaxID=3363902 RepID=UPI0037185667